MNFKSNRIRLIAGGICVLTLALLAGSLVKAQSSQSQPDQRWLHVRVDDPTANNRMVHANVPLALAEALVANVNTDKLEHGHLRLGPVSFNGADLHQLLDAVRSAPDGEFVNVKTNDQEVRVAKEKGYLVVHVTETQKTQGTSEDIEVHMPLSVVEALVSSASNDLHELNIAGALHALATHSGDTDLVNVKQGHQTIHVWLDSKSSE